MSNKSGNEIQSKRSWNFNEHINLILLSMFMIVILTILCFKCCSGCKHVPKTDSEILQQPHETANDSTQTQLQ